jgi:hypothetical protein
MKIIILLLLASVALALPAAPQAPQIGSVRVTLVAGPSPSKGGRTELVRRAQRTPTNVVIVDKNATAEDLAAALAMLNALRAQFGDSLTTDFRARPDVVRPGPTWQKSAYRSWLIEQLVRLRTATPAVIADLGLVRSVQIALPAPRGTISGDGAQH